MESCSAMVGKTRWDKRTEGQENGGARESSGCLAAGCLARQLGTSTSRTNRELNQADIDRIAATVHGSRANGEVQQSHADVPGFCYSAKLEGIEKNRFVLTSGRYVGAAEQEEDGEHFEHNMQRLTALLKQQQEGAKLDAAIARNLAWLGFGDSD